jgi:hypothetical protein
MSTMHGHMNIKLNGLNMKGSRQDLIWYTLPQNVPGRIMEGITNPVRVTKFENFVPLFWKKY